MASAASEACEDNSQLIRDPEPWISRCDHDAGALSDDAFIRIFGYLHGSDRIRLELVCKRWRNLLRHSWKKMREFYWKFDESSSSDFKLVTTRNQVHLWASEDAMQTLMRRCDHNLRTLVIASPFEQKISLECEILHSASRSFRFTLTNLCIARCELENNFNFDFIGPQLEELALISCCFKFPCDFNFGERFPILRNLDISDTEPESWNFLLTLPKTLESLSLMNLKPDLGLLVGFFRYHANLKALHMSKFLFEGSDARPVFVENFPPHLDRFSFFCEEINTVFEDLQNAGKLYDLKSISFSNVDARCKNFNTIFDGMPNLRTLDLFSLGPISDLNFSHSVNKLTFLRSLSLSGFPINDEMLAAATRNLSELAAICLSDAHFSNSGLLALISNCPKLQWIYIDCPKATIDGMIAFISALQDSEVFRPDRSVHICIPSLTSPEFEHKLDWPGLRLYLEYCCETQVSDRCYRCDPMTHRQYSLHVPSSFGFMYSVIAREFKL